MAVFKRKMKIHYWLHYWLHIDNQWLGKGCVAQATGFPVLADCLTVLSAV